MTCYPETCRVCSVIVQPKLLRSHTIWGLSIHSGVWFATYPMHTPPCLSLSSLTALTGPLNPHQGAPPCGPPNHPHNPNSQTPNRIHHLGGGA